ncbi:MAG: ABC transporter permease [Clostridiales bacterium]|nr:ABC transporter permease [Clostridiales bacterium]
MLKRLRLYVLIALAAMILLVAVFGPLLAPDDPFRIDLRNTVRPPGSGHWLGTDTLGRDLFSRLLYGARNSFALTLAMVLIVTIVGAAIGLAAGYIGGFADALAMQAADILLAFPTMVFAIAVAGIMGPSIYHTIIALGAVSWAKYARLTSGLVKDIRRSNYLIQARFGGARLPRIVIKYILPNALPHIVIMTTLDIGEMMITISTLSFLGLVTPPPAPEWGNMIAASRNGMLLYPHMLIYTSMVLIITVVVFNLLGDSLRDFLDPKLSHAHAPRKRSRRNTAKGTGTT